MQLATVLNATDIGGLTVEAFPLVVVDLGVRRHYCAVLALVQFPYVAEFVLRVNLHRRAVEALDVATVQHAGLDRRQLEHLVVSALYRDPRRLHPTARLAVACVRAAT